VTPAIRLASELSIAGFGVSKASLDRGMAPRVSGWTLAVAGVCKSKPRLFRRIGFGDECGVFEMNKEKS
jgi:hypothetical protein